MTLIALGCFALALLLTKFGALLVWVAVLSTALKGLLLLAAMGALTYLTVHIWKRHKQR